MNALVQTIEHFETGFRLPAGVRKVLYSLGIVALLTSGFAVASALGFLQAGMGITESSRILAVLAASLGWIYLALAIDEERISDALPDAASFILVTGFALMSLGGDVRFVAAAFGVHLVRAILRLAEGRSDPAANNALLAWTGFAFGAVLVSLAGMG
jgi:hypothetical protein